jgi:hypothetical protein
MSNNVKHTRIGVWDLYEDKSETPTSSRLRWPEFKSYALLAQALPYVYRMMRDIASTPDCSILLLAYLLVELIISLIPALSLYYSGKLLNIVSFVRQCAFSMLFYFSFLGTDRRRSSHGRQAIAVPRRSRKFCMFCCN